MDELVAVCGKWQGNKGFPERLHKVDANNQSKQTTKIVLVAADYVAVAKRAILSAAALFCISAGGNVAIRTGLPASCPAPHFPISFFPTSYALVPLCSAMWLNIPLLFTLLPDNPLAIFLSSQLPFVAFNAA